MRTRLDDIDRLFNYNINLSTKTLYMGSVSSDFDYSETGVDHNLAANVIKGLHILDNQANDKPITITLNNPGGDWYHGMAIYDHIRLCKSHIIIVATGYVMSMGSIIFQAADERHMTKHSKMMIHYGSMSVEGSSKDVLRAAEEEREVNEQMETIYLDRIRQKQPKYSRSNLKKLLINDTYISPLKAIELGLCDKVLGDE